MSTIKADSIQSLSNTSDLVFSTGVGSIERMRIDSNGNIGIGGISPSVKLDVNGRGRFVSAGAGVMSGAITLREDSGNNPAYIQWVDNTNTTNRGNMVVDASSNMLFYTGSGATERMRITSGGNVGVGNSSPSSTISVNGTVSCSSLTVKTASINPTTSAPLFGARAWIVFNSYNGAIYKSYNVTRIDPYGGQSSGGWKVTFTTPAPATNQYTVISMHNHHGGGGTCCTMVYELNSAYSATQFWRDAAPANPTVACLVYFW